MKRFAILISLYVGCLSSSFGQAPTIYTLDECRQMAVENNTKVKLAEGKAEEAREVSRQAFTKYFPTIEANWIGFQSNRGVLQYTLPNLGTYIPELGDCPLGTISLIKKGWTGSITALQPIFAGGQIVNGNRLAHVGEEAATLEMQGAIDDVLLTAEKYYWQISTLKAKKRTLTSVLSLIDTLEYQVNVAVEAGVKLPNELLKVKLRRNELRADMVDLDNGITLACNLLAQYIGHDGERIDVAEEDSRGELPLFPSDLYVEPSMALTTTPDYQLLNAQVKAASLRTRMAVGENLPTVGLGAGWFYDDLLSQRHNFGAVMLTVNVPITAWWGGSHKIKESRVAENNARMQMTDLSQMLEIEMQNTWDDLTAAYRKIEIAHESIGQSTENLRLNENYYQYGVSTITDLLDAQALYRQTLDQYSEAYGDYCVARAAYLKSTGRIANLSLR
ncbi:MAG: TolC family protein [Bacteroidales bacterium]|nr:TolC family protein [Bacteroidales bacterium]